MTQYFLIFLYSPFPFLIACIIFLLCLQKKHRQKVWVKICMVFAIALVIINLWMIDRGFQEKSRDGLESRRYFAIISTTRYIERLLIKNDYEKTKSIIHQFNAFFDESASLKKDKKTEVAMKRFVKEQLPKDSWLPLELDNSSWSN